VNELRGLLGIVLSGAYTMGNRLGLFDFPINSFSFVGAYSLFNLSSLFHSFARDELFQRGRVMLGLCALATSD
jgi:hypothetical protein